MATKFAIKIANHVFCIYIYNCPYHCVFIVSVMVSLMVSLMLSFMVSLMVSLMQSLMVSLMVSLVVSPTVLDAVSLTRCLSSSPSQYLECLIARGFDLLEAAYHWKF